MLPFREFTSEYDMALFIADRLPDKFPKIVRDDRADYRIDQKIEAALKIVEALQVPAPSVDQPYTVRLNEKGDVFVKICTLTGHNHSSKTEYDGCVYGWVNLTNRSIATDRYVTDFLIIGRIPGV